MDVFIREVKDYTCILIKFLLSFFLIQNIHLIPCRNVFNLKRKVKNNAYVETLICKAYIVEKISTFILSYFKPQLRTSINLVPMHDDSWEVLSSEHLSIFSHPGRLVPKTIEGKILEKKIKSRHAHNYILFNCDELRSFIQ